MSAPLTPKEIVARFINDNPHDDCSGIVTRVTKAVTTGAYRDYESDFLSEIITRLFKSLTADERAQEREREAERAEAKRQAEAEAERKRKAALPKSVREKLADEMQRAERKTRLKEEEAALAVTMQAKVAELRENKVRMSLLDLMAPNGKLYGDCTFAEVGQFAGFWKAVSKSGPAQGILREYLSDAKLYKLQTWKDAV